jgi:hypothetical protein
MWTDTPEGRKLIQELSKDIVVEVAPEEMDLFDELVKEYFHDPTPPDVSAKPKDVPLGFGLGEVLIAVTPAATAMVNEVLKYVMSESINTAKEESAEAVKKQVKKLFIQEKEHEKPAKKEDGEVRPLNKEQLEQVKKLARKQAIKFGISEDKAEKMANALIGSLVLAK